MPATDWCRKAAQAFMPPYKLYATDGVMIFQAFGSPETMALKAVSDLLTADDTAYLSMMAARLPGMQWLQHSRNLMSASPADNLSAVVLYNAERTITF